MANSKLLQGYIETRVEYKTEYDAKDAGRIIYRHQKFNAKKIMQKITIIQIIWCIIIKETMNEKLKLYANIQSINRKITRV